MSLVVCNTYINSQVSPILILHKYLKKVEVVYVRGVIKPH